MAKFKIPGHPVGKERPRKGRYGGFYTPEKTREYENLVALSAVAAGLLPFKDVGVIVEIEWRRYGQPDEYLEVEVKAKDGVPKVRPDIDNVIKSVLDGLIRIAYNNDNQVTEVTMKVRRD